MTNDKLPETMQEQIKADAQLYTKDEGYQKAHIAGATTWAGWKVKFDELKDRFDKQLTIEQELLKAAEVSLRASQAMADALEFVKANGLCSETTDVINKALQQFKDGKEEVGDE